MLIWFFSGFILRAPHTFNWSKPSFNVALQRHNHVKDVESDKKENVLEMLLECFLS